MATIAQKPLFGWDQIEVLGDLKRLQLVLENPPDEPLVKKLEKEHPDGRGDSDGEWGIHEYRCTHADGAAWQTVKKWFGDAIHLLV